MYWLSFIFLAYGLTAAHSFNEELYERQKSSLSFWKCFLNPKNWSCAKKVLTGVREEWKIYKDTDGKDVPMSVDTAMKDDNMAILETQHLRFGPLPCSCDTLECGCCASMNYFNRTGCMNITYDPDAFSLTMDMIMNEELVYTNSFSAKNPPPACLEAPIPYFPSVAFCVRLFDIYTPGSNIHMCINFETRIVRAPVLVLEFDCVQMGYDGFTHGKPTKPTKKPNPSKPAEDSTTTLNPSTKTI